MAKNNNIQIKFNQTEIINTMFPTVKQFVDDSLKNEILNYYTNMTLQEKKKKLNQYKKQFKNILDGFKDNKKSVSYYFDAYEFILQFRKFILSKLGNINYSFVWSVKQRGKGGNVIVRTATLDSEKFVNLLKDNNGKLIGLQDSDGNLRFNSTLLKKLKSELKDLQKEGIDITINQNCSSFSLINEIVGTKQDFADGKLFKAKIDALQRNQRVAKWYRFVIETTKDISKKDRSEVFKFNVKEVHNSPKSSSVFSAIGKYFADEMITKRVLAQQNKISVDPSYPNAGNLTEMYIAAKARLNNSHNNFKERTPVAGEDLFEIYNEIKANTEPFYSGGDYLMNQIKSFLSSNPSLTSFSTIEKTIKSFYEALNMDNFNQMKQELSKLLLQKPATVSTVTQEERMMAQSISECFLFFFSDLTK